MIEMKCYKCQTVKEESEFGWRNKEKGKRSPWCKDCRRSYDKETRKNRYQALKQRKLEENTEPV